jgi:hypothetical protein
MQRVRTLLLVIITLAIVVLVVQHFRTKEHVPEAPVAPEEAPISEIKGPFEGKGLRFDGYYMETCGELLYLVRFFPEGRAVLVNGTSDLREQLPPLLVRDAKGDPTMGWYNVPVTVQGDSLFFTTRPEKGTIDYGGIVVDGSTVRFMRTSNITGTRQLKEYLFQPDVLEQ